MEFALVFPLFMLIIFGLFDAGRLIFTYNTVSNAARDGARVAIVNQSTSGSDTCDTTSQTAWPTGCVIASGIGIDLAPTDIDVQYRNPTDTGVCSVPTLGCIAVVEVTGTFRPLTPVIGQLIGNVTLTSTTKMAIERVCTNPTTAPIPHC